MNRKVTFKQRKESRRVVEVDRWLKVKMAGDWLLWSDWKWQTDSSSLLDTPFQIEMVGETFLGN